ncbi:MAG: hypothetical protein JKY42_06165 [Flavobacteriales bacterium]|nr:hypothetical protein [Flavobacteriales bacterium]
MRYLLIATLIVISVTYFAQNSVPSFKSNYFFYSLYTTPAPHIYLKSSGVPTIGMSFYKKSSFRVETDLNFGLKSGNFSDYFVDGILNTIIYEKRYLIWEKNHSAWVK